jgi:trans-aconitate methyltransferase
MPVTAFGTAMLQFIAGQGNGALMVNRGIVPGYCRLFVALRNDESQLLTRLVTGWPEDRDLRVLDVGCGVGRHVAAMAGLRPASKITGIERCDAMRAHCCAQFPNHKFLSDIKHLAADETFDLMLLMGNGLGVLGGTAQDVRQGLQGLLAHLSDDGVLVIESTDHPGHPGFGVMPVVIAHGRNNIPPQSNLASSPSTMPGPPGFFHEIRP